MKKVTTKSLKQEIQQVVGQLNLEIKQNNEDYGSDLLLIEYSVKKQRGEDSWEIVATCDYRVFTQKISAMDSDEFFIESSYNNVNNQDLIEDRDDLLNSAILGLYQLSTIKSI